MFNPNYGVCNIGDGGPKVVVESVKNGVSYTTSVVKDNSLLEFKRSIFSKYVLTDEKLASIFSMDEKELEETTDLIMKAVNCLHGNAIAKELGCEIENFRTKRSLSLLNTKPTDNQRKMLKGNVVNIGDVTDKSKESRKKLDKYTQTPMFEEKKENSQSKEVEKNLTGEPLVSIEVIEYTSADLRNVQSNPQKRKIYLTIAEYQKLVNALQGKNFQRVTMKKIAFNPSPVCPDLPSSENDPVNTVPLHPGFSSGENNAGRDVTSVEDLRKENFQNLLRFQQYWIKKSKKDANERKEKLKNGSTNWSHYTNVYSSLEKRGKENFEMVNKEDSNTLNLVKENCPHGNEINNEDKENLQQNIQENVLKTCCCQKIENVLNRVKNNDCRRKLLAKNFKFIYEKPGNYNEALKAQSRGFKAKKKIISNSKASLLKNKHFDSKTNENAQCAKEKNPYNKVEKIDKLNNGPFAIKNYSSLEEIKNDMLKVNSLQENSTYVEKTDKKYFFSSERTEIVKSFTEKRISTEYTNSFEKFVENLIKNKKIDMQNENPTSQNFLLKNNYKTCETITTTTRRTINLNISETVQKHIQRVCPYNLRKRKRIFYPRSSVTYKPRKRNKGKKSFKQDKRRTN